MFPCKTYKYQVKYYYPIAVFSTMTIVAEISCYCILLNDSYN